ncbi:hypothetical protein CYY_005894 [Polysphondylium violaceum]|uniref:Kinetochore protein Sos7 coiled-coil domain-containing protein n=1 Tax=Polysphondylium violaceum TaxID=133409 RepID=A0A8J4UZC1_9MYCE|nr:hypothetical protein CYY_005894 [Polysphondylium violaceum]
MKEQEITNLNNYYDIINTISNDLFTFLSKNDVTNKNFEKEINRIQENFSTLKFNFAEMGSKQKFMKSINQINVPIQSPNQSAIDQMEANISKEKKEFKEIKEQNTKLFAEVVKIISSITVLDDKFKNDKEALITLVQEANSQFEKIQIIKQSLQELQESSNRFEQNSQNQMKSKLSSSALWYTKFNQFAQLIQGYKVLPPSSPSTLCFEFNFQCNSRSQTHILTLHASSTNNSVSNLDSPPHITGYHLSPPLPKSGRDYESIFHEYIQDNANLTWNDIGDLVMEFKNSLSCFYLADTEINQLQTNYSVTRKHQTCRDELSITLPKGGFVCNFSIDYDYPKYSNIQINFIQKPNNFDRIENLSFIQKKINENRWNLSQLLEEIDYYLE